MSSLAPTGDQPMEADVKPSLSAPTTEPLRTATSELNGALQSPEHPLLAVSFAENAADASTTDNDAVQTAPIDNKEKSSANAAQDPSLTLDVPCAGASSTDIHPASTTWQAAKEAIESSSAPQNIDSTSAAWAAARESVLKSMGSEDNDQVATIQGNRGRGRGRPRNSTLPNGDRTAAIEAGTGLPGDQSLTTPIRRGRGGRPRGRGSGRSKGRAARRRRGDDGAGDVSDSDEFSDDSGQQAKDPIVTKSGRSVTKPSQYNPVIEPSPSSGTKRKRSQQPKFADQIWCVKCLRGHSPPSNQIVLCDGCDAAYHQWCHDPLIEKEIAENIQESWFCGNCLHAKETSGLPVQQRVPAGNLTYEEKSEYLNLLSKPTLISLLLHGTSLHPDLPVFALNTRQLLQTLPKSHVPRPAPNPPLPSPPSSQSWQQQQQQQPGNQHMPVGPPIGQPTQQMHPHSQAQISPANTEHIFPADPYPEYSNEAGDPPGTYPRPGRGPIKLQATTHPEDMPWMVQDNYEVFAHLVSDGTGRLVPMQQRPEGWPGHIASGPAQNGTLQHQPQTQHQNPYVHPHAHAYPQQHPDYRHMYPAAQPPPHSHPAVSYAPHMPPQHAPQHFQQPDMQQRAPQWTSAYGMQRAEQMQQQHQQQQQQQQHQHPGQPGTISYESTQQQQMQ